MANINYLKTGAGLIAVAVIIIIVINQFTGKQELKGEEACESKETGEVCRMEVSNEKDCYIYNTAKRPEERATWSGECKRFRDEGLGDIRFEWEDEGSEWMVVSGTLKEGRMEGIWTITTSTGIKATAMFLEGRAE